MGAIHAQRQSLDVTATLSICDNKRQFISRILDNQDLSEIDATLGNLNSAEPLPLEQFKRSLPLLKQEPDLGESRLDSVVEALESARKGEYAPLRAMFERNNEVTSSLIAGAYLNFPEKYNVRKDFETGGLLSAVSQEILTRDAQGIDARKRLALSLSVVPDFNSWRRYLLYAAWTAAYVLVTIATGLNEELGLRAAGAVVNRLYARRRGREYLRRLQAV